MSKTQESFIIFYASCRQCFQQDFQVVGLFPEFLGNPFLSCSMPESISAWARIPHKNKQTGMEYKGKKIKSKAQKTAQCFPKGSTETLLQNSYLKHRCSEWSFRSTVWSAEGDSGGIWGIFSLAWAWESTVAKEECQQRQTIHVISQQCWLPYQHLKQVSENLLELSTPHLRLGQQAWEKLCQWEQSGPGLSQSTARPGKVSADHTPTGDASFLALLTDQEEHEALWETLDLP